ncbi:MAG: YkgJ family cysteine cluster protein [Candidatus Omnitrophica bacterium]|nr:YkgJ family cysteine cluster protein [Candidatus Omnitrophota bacterium]MDD5042803.1 YkgJ family cysteine cluster protein [Candidatus Omnitrophota bacterium]MDD5500884.1 YkgJ family cysteine cluster protein [Candidatus Omnitrophota bacterium]
MIRQFVPQEFCMKCKGCCRFKEQDSVWSPCLLDEEIQVLLDRKDIPPASISINRRIQPVSAPCESGFICPFLGVGDNKCAIYSARPFECQLYPFLINLRKGKVLLTVDLNCPYVYERINSPEAKEYIAYLSGYLNSPDCLGKIKDNPQIIQAYEEVREVAEIKLPNEIE